MRTVDVFLSSLFSKRERHRPARCEEPNKKNTISFQFYQSSLYTFFIFNSSEKSKTFFTVGVETRKANKEKLFLLLRRLRLS